MIVMEMFLKIFSSSDLKCVARNCRGWIENSGWL